MSEETPDSRQDLVGNLFTHKILDASITPTQQAGHNSVVCDIRINGSKFTAIVAVSALVVLFSDNTWASTPVLPTPDKTQE